MLLIDHFERAATWFSGRMAVQDDERAITYAEMRILGLRDDEVGPYLSLMKRPG